jgi:hypothetical protein
MRWSGRSAVALLALLTGAAAAAAGESFLDRNPKVHEAIPYEREAPTPADTPTPAAHAPHTP